MAAFKTQVVAETDGASHINNVTYLKYLEIARKKYTSAAFRSVLKQWLQT